MNHYVCPQCQSDNIQNVRVLYEAGTSTSTLSGHAVGVVGAGHSSYALMGGRAITTKRQQTLLAERYAPPRAPRFSEALSVMVLSAGILVAFLVPVIMYMASIKELGPSGKLTCGAFGALLGAVIIVGGIKIRVAESNKYKRLYSIYEGRLAEWQRSYVCNRCDYYGPLT